MSAVKPHPLKVTRSEFETVRPTLKRSLSLSLLYIASFFYLGTTAMPEFINWGVLATGLAWSWFNWGSYYFIMYMVNNGRAKFREA